MWAPAPFDIARFTRVAPMSAKTRGAFGPPRLTFSWRDDRYWSHRGRELDGEDAAQHQADLLAQLCDMIRSELPELDVAVTGYGTAGRLPPSIADLRADRRTDAIERGWVERYARSHATMGVYGSNMLLPMAHSGGAVQLVPSDMLWVMNHAIEFLNRRLSVSTALGQIFTIPTSASLSDIAMIAIATMQRVAQNLSYGIAGAAPAPWIFKEIRGLQRRNERGEIV
jgi:hypothetical protein